MNLKNATLLVIMAGTAIFGISSATLLQHAHASIIGDFGIGYNNGKIDRYNGYQQADCSQYSNSYCLGYSTGYNAEDLAISQAQP